MVSCSSQPEARTTTLEVRFERELLVSKGTFKFSFDRVKDVRKAFSTACRKAGIEDFHIHDLRHTFASWLVMNGTPLFEVSKLLRHASIQMTERYAHLAPDHLHDAVDNLGFSAH